MTYTMGEESPCILVDSTNSSQVVRHVNYEPSETCQNIEALHFALMVMSGPHYFSSSLRINDNIGTKTFPQGTFHEYFMHGSFEVYYSLVNSLHQFYDSHCIFYDRNEVWLEGSYSYRFFMNNINVIFCMMDRGLQNLISSLLLLLFQLLIFYEHVIVGLELHGCIH